MSERPPKTILVLTTAIISMLILAINSIGLLSNIAFAQNNNNNKLVITDGIASGDVTDNSAVVWSRANDRALMHVQYGTNLSFSHANSKILLVDKSTDFAGHIKLDSLSPDTIYYYRV
jgi:alkaline phosphatase D